MNLLFRLVAGIHIVGVVIMAGTTMIDYLTYRTFWKLASTESDRALGLIQLMAKYGAYIRTGAITIILTGVGLLVLDKGVAWAHPWFKVKMTLVVALVLNGMLIGNKQGHMLRETVAAHPSNFVEYAEAIREAMNLFYPIQLCLFFVVILISMISNQGLEGN